MVEGADESVNMRDLPPAAFPRPMVSWSYGWLTSRMHDLVVLLTRGRQRPNRPLHLSRNAPVSDRLRPSFL